MWTGGPCLIGVSYRRSTTLCCTAVILSSSCRDRCGAEDARHVPFAAVAVRPTLISLDGLAAGFAIIVHLGLQ